MISQIKKILFEIVILFVDYANKKKIINFFKKKINDNSIVIIDIGAHKGETINLFINNFNVKKIFSFEANPEIFKLIKKKFEHIKFKGKIFLHNIALGEKRDQKYFNVIKDSSSSTFNSINMQSNYYKKKLNFLNIFSQNTDFIEKKFLLNIKPLNEFTDIFNCKNIDILKIDTEGYELNILKGISKNNFHKIKFIYLEHHYDLMVKKDYKYSDLKNYLNKNNFYLKYKIKMSFRKTFEYIFENEKSIS